MATASFCDPCTEANSSVSATLYCSDCEERFCQDCAASHTRFKAFKSHHVIDLSSIGSNIPIFAKKTCNVHLDMLLDYYCTDHEIVCCRACIPKEHRKCENVLPLEHASMDVKQSALFTNVMQDIKHLVTTLKELYNNRESNLQLLMKSKSLITKQISEVKSRLLKHIDNLEHDLHAKLSSLQRKHEIEINKQKEEVLSALESLKSNENEIDFLKDHGSNNQLFISLHQQIANTKTDEAKVPQIVSNLQEIEITFDEKKYIEIDYFGPLLQTVKPCQVYYKSKKFQQAQIRTELTKQDCWV
ncbi:transcription intermediary factor 1-beta-like [Mytilus californianus]|uniref:transcription intermediary factor 1-beta-like n=1 Tax=Mytilus californianus TaxID=6549 RepID=UPI00224591BA|nr:transcription intermediary factor 1-beta-like [Mytilus californianus]